MAELVCYYSLMWGLRGAFGRGKISPMADITCPQCQRTIPADSVGKESLFCPFCGWSGQREMPAKQLPGEVAAVARRRDGPVEEVFFSVRESALRFVGSVIVMNTYLAAAVGGVSFFLFLAVCLLGKAPLLAAPIAALVLSVFGWLVFAIFTIPVMFFVVFLRRARHYEAKGKFLDVELGRRRRTHDLSECSWRRCGRIPADAYGFYFRTGPRLVLLDERHRYGLGFSDETAAEWIEHFEAIGVKERPPVSWFRQVQRFCICLAAGLAGGAVGAVVEPWCGLPQRCRGGVIFLGFLESAFLVEACQIAETRKHWGASRVSIALVVALMFGGLAIHIVGIFAWHVCVANALLGAVAGWFVGPEKDDRRDA